MYTQLLKILGKRGAFWLSVSALAGVCLTLIEISLAAALQHILFLLDANTNRLGSILSQLSPFVFLVVFILINISKGLLTLLSQQSSVVCNEIIATKMRRSVLSKVFLASYEIPSLSSTLSSISDWIPKSLQFTSLLFAAIPNVFYLLVSGSYLFYISPAHTFIGFICVSIIGVTVLNLNKKVRAIAQDLPASQERLTSNLVRTIKNWILLKTLRTTPLEFKRAHNESVNQSLALIRASFFANLGGMAPGVLGSITITVLIAYQLHFHPHDSKDFIIFLYLFIKFVQTLAGVTTNLGHMKITQPHFENSIKVFLSNSDFMSSDFVSKDKYIPEIPSLNLIGKPKKQSSFKSATAVDQTTTINEIQKPPLIQIQNLGFSYASKTVLSDLSFSISPGSQYGITGPNGAGKSTLLCLMTGLLKPTSGSILFDNKTPEDYFAQAHGRISYVGPEPFIIAGTIRENLIYGNFINFSDLNLKEALRAADLDFELDYLLTENGQGLSTGQKQRLCIARAFLTKPVFLILDEASSNLDTSTEQSIIKSLKLLKGSCTTVIVSHRAALLQHIDHIIEMKPMSHS